MAVLSAIHPTLLDVTKRLDPGGKIDQIAELLSQTNAVLEDMVWVEGNLPTGHRTTVRTGLPAVTWRKLYGGVQPSKSTTAQVTDSCGMLEAYAEVDKALADLNGNTAEFRLSEDMAFIEAMGQEQAGTIFYGNEGSEPEAFTGFLPRFNSFGAASGDNVLKGGSDADAVNTSIWLVGWGRNTVFGIYPKGSKAGLTHTDKGVVTIENAGDAATPAALGGGRYEAYRSHYRWDNGLCVRDWRNVVRICDIKTTALTLTGAGGTDSNLWNLMSRAIELIPNPSAVRLAFYCNRTILSFAMQQAITKVAGSTLTMEQLGGKSVLTCRGVPIRRCDQLLNTEDRIAA